MIRDSPVGRLRPVQHTNLKGSRGTADLVPNTNQIGRAAYCPCSLSRNGSSAGVKKKTGGERWLRKELISDGIHLHTAECVEWQEYLKTHPVEKDL